MTILAGDIGGTKTHLALFDDQDPNLFHHLMTYPSKDYPDLTTIVCDYLAKIKPTKEIQFACFAVAGPVVEGISKITNLPWVISAEDLKAKTNIQHLFLINDLEAGAYSIEILPPESLFVLNAGQKRVGNKAVVSPGTGLGEAGLVWDGKKYLPFASEGGHCDFAPTSELQIELAAYFFSKIGHFSYDRLLCGPGFSNLYEFFTKTGKFSEPKWLIEELKNSDHGAIITQNALNGKSELCIAILDLYLEIFGQEVSNVALKFMALGGVYLGGGIPPKILPRLQSSSAFLRGYKNKGRFRSFVENIPVKILLDDKANLKGAAHYTLFSR